MYALRERRVHVTQEDFELAVAKVMVSNVFFFMIFFQTVKHVLLLYHLPHAEQDIYIYKNKSVLSVNRHQNEPSIK